nr:MAG TPA: tail protein [Caudoviricetes sp.]
MATNTYNSKVIFNGEVLMDLTGDTVTPAQLLKGITAHGKDGAPITGTCDWDAATGDATAAAAEILSGKTAYVKGKKVTGTMPNRGAVSGKISTKAGAYTVPQGYHDGSGKVTIDSTEQAKLIPTNIRNGVTVLGVEGTMSGSEDMKPQSKSVIPKASAQTVLPDEDYNCLSQVEVAAIPYAVSDNTSGGRTVTIG